MNTEDDIKILVALFFCYKNFRVFLTYFHSWHNILCAHVTYANSEINICTKEM